MEYENLLRSILIVLSKVRSAFHRMLAVHCNLMWALIRL